MAKAKTKATKKPARKDKKQSPEVGPDLGGWDIAELESEFKDSALSWEDRQLLGNVIRFLYTVVNPKLLRRALRAGYSRGEHKLLWALFDSAAGREKELDDIPLATEDDPERARLLLEVDEFENLWLPRTDRIIRRVVPSESVDKFIATFFHELTQQPFGPAVLDSVSTYLGRVSQLTTSKLPGAARVLETLRARGLTDGKIAEIQKKVATLKEAAKASPPDDGSAKQAAAEKQAAALRDLRLAWNDWATTLRPVYDIREQIQLGLTAPRATRKVDGDPPDDSSGGSGEKKPD